MQRAGKKAEYKKPNTFAWNRWIRADQGNEKALKDFFKVSQEEVEYRRKQSKALGEFSTIPKRMKGKKHGKGEARIPKNWVKYPTRWLRDEERGVVRRKIKINQEAEKKRVRKSRKRPKLD